MAQTNAHIWGDLADDEAAAALLSSAMSTIDNRVDYGDARLVEAEELRLYHQLDRDPDERLEKSIGIGVRVLVDGSWGFAAAPLSDAGAQRRLPARRGPGLNAPRTGHTGDHGAANRQRRPRARPRRPCLG